MDPESVKSPTAAIAIWAGNWLVHRLGVDLLKGGGSIKKLSIEPQFEDEGERLELLARLIQIPGVTLGWAAIDRRPSISLGFWPGPARLEDSPMRWTGYFRRLELRPLTQAF